MPQGLSAELVVERYASSRVDLDEFALRSHHLAAQARDAGRFQRELWPVESRTRNAEGDVEAGDLVGADTGIGDTSLAALAALSPVFREGGTVTAGDSSQISDGAASTLLTSERRAGQLQLAPLARIVDFAVVGTDPIEMLTGPIPATTLALKRAGLTLDDIDLFEINEAFAPVVLAWQRALSVDPDRVNVNGGAIALGHPLGATGVRLIVILAHELARRSGRYRLATICEGGGMANAIIIENLT